MTDISKNVQTLIKKAYHVPSTYHNTKWWNETSHIYQNTFEANDINAQTVPITPVWSDVSYSESSLYELGIHIDTTDSFASTDASFIETISGDAYYSDFVKSPGAYLDSTGTVMLFVRLKLDKMITDSENIEYGVDPNAIAYVKYGASNLILNGSFEEGATVSGTHQSSSAAGGIPNWTTDISNYVFFINNGNSVWSSGDAVATYDSSNWLIALQYKDTSISQTVGNLEAGSYNISFAVAARYNTSDISASPFLLEVKNANSGEILVDLSDTSVVNWTYHAFSFDITSHNTDITVTFTNNHSIAIGQGDADRTVFFDAVELKKQAPCSILSNSYQYNYNTQRDVSGASESIPVFKPYNYKLEYSEDDGNNFTTTLTNDVGNWAFDFKSGIITFGNDPSDNTSEDIDISTGDLYFTFVKYVGLRGVNNLDTINGDLSVGGSVTDITWCDEANTTLKIAGDTYMDGDLIFGQVSGADSYGIKCQDGFIIGRTGSNITGAPTEENSYAYFSMDMNTVNISAFSNVNICTGSNAGYDSINGTIGLTVNSSGTDISGDLTVGGDIQFNNGGDTFQNIWRNGSLRIGYNSSSSDPNNNLGDTAFSYASFETDLFLGGSTVVIKYGAGAGAGAGVIGLTVSSTGTDITGYLTVGETDISGNLLVSGTANISSNLTVGGTAEITSTTSIKNGNTADATTKAQIALGFDGNTVHQHFIASRHNSLNASGNAIDFYLCDGTEKNNSISSGCDRIMTVDNEGVGIYQSTPSCALDVNGSANISSDLDVYGKVSLKKTSYSSVEEDWALDICGTVRIKDGVTIGRDGVLNIVSYNGADSYGDDTESCAIQTSIDNFGLHDKTYDADGEIYNYIDFAPGAHKRRVLTLQPYMGHVGIGLTDPNINYLLDISGTTNISSDLTVGGIFYPYNISKSSTLVVGVRSGSGEATTTNSYSWAEFQSSKLALGGPFIELRPDSNDTSTGSVLVKLTTGEMYVNGYVGIGEDSPSYPLEVNGSAGSKTGYYLDQERGKSDSTHEWWYSGQASDDTYSARIYEDTNEALTIYSSGSVGINSGKYYYLSDKRIKTNIRDISDDEALVAFRKLQPKTYNYKDPLKSGYNSVYGFIAQEVEEVIPNSTLKDTGFIPNIYRVCEIDNSSNILTFHFGTSGETIEQFDLSINDIIQIEDVSKNMIERTIINIIDETSIQVNDEYIPVHTHDSSGIELSCNKVFVYGKKVDDLHRLGKDSIWTVAAAALQEVDRQQQADKVRISELETEVATLKTQASTFETQMSELMARISSLENNNSTTTTDTSDNTTSTDGS